jgi:hypothetical protein
VYTYESPGAYPVSLTVSTALDTKTATKQDYIHAGHGLPAAGYAQLVVPVAAIILASGFLLRMVLRPRMKDEDT